MVRIYNECVFFVSELINGCVSGPLRVGINSSLSKHNCQSKKADLFAGSVFIQVALGWDIYVSIICLLAITAVYAVTGGLKAVIYVEGVQTVIMVAGGFILLILSMQEVIIKIYHMFTRKK